MLGCHLDVAGALWTNGAPKYVLQSTWEADFVAIYYIGPDFVAICLVITHRNEHELLLKEIQNDHRIHEEQKTEVRYFAIPPT